MPRALPLTRVVTKAVACDHLGICKRTFDRHWAVVFTDARDKAERTNGVDRGVFEDELTAAVEAGGRIYARAKAAVYQVRKLMGRVPAQAKTARNTGRRVAGTRKRPRGGRTRGGTPAPVTHPDSARLP